MTLITFLYISLCKGWTHRFRTDISMYHSNQTGWDSNPALPAQKVDALLTKPFRFTVYNIAILSIAYC